MSNFSAAPGKRTSEFYTMIGSMLVGLLVIFKVVEPTAQAELTTNINAIVMAIVALIGAIGPGVAYILSRTWLKAKTSTEIKNV